MTTVSYCFCGKVLWVDLGTGRTWVEEIPPGLYRRVLGGYGLGVKILLDRLTWITPAFGG